ncbi:MAG: DUF3043 domain-containing protein [Propionibacteriaceae bacterium]|nr:DUF3043 domain-containing protein [Propionibacteriaceae bacterium]
MGLFKPYDAEPTKEVQTPPKPNATAKKSIPTPTRKQAEQARRQRLQPVLTRKQANAIEREARYKSRDEQLAKTHALPYNALIRDWVDHRWNLAEFALPGMLLVFVGTMVGAYFLPSLMMATSYIIWGIFLLLIIDTFLMWFGCRTNLKLYFPGEPLKGKFSYAMSRSMLMRRSRIPAPRVKRGSRFQWPYTEGNS